jgi:hypothetical protein
MASRSSSDDEVFGFAGSGSVHDLVSSPESNDDQDAVFVGTQFRLNASDLCKLVGILTVGFVLWGWRR